MTDPGSSPLPAPSDAGPPSGRERREFVSLMASRVRDVYLRKPFFVDASTDLVTLCRELSRRGLSDALVRDGDRLGIFTTTNLREALVRPEPPSELPVGALATFDPWWVAPDADLYDAMLLMLRHRVHRLVVKDGDQITGVLGQLDLMAFVASHSHLIALQISHAEDLVELKAAAGQIDSLISVLQSDGVRVAVIAGIVGELNRQLFSRLWALIAPADLIANSCLIVMGSEGRSEQIIKTDQDNALLIRDGFVLPELDTITAAFTAALIEFGYPPCPGGIMLSRPLWCQPLAAFRDTIRDWIYGTDPEGPMHLSIFLDAQPVAGDRGILDAARAHLDFLLSDNAPWFSRFAFAVEQFSEPKTWWSRLPGLSGRAAAEIDLKKLGLFPIVQGVRALALQYRVPAAGTGPRLTALVAAGHMDAPLARDLTDALHFLMGLKLSNNLRQIAAGTPAGNTLRLSDLGTLDRQALKDSLAIVRQFKQWLAHHYRFDAL